MDWYFHWHLKNPSFASFNSSSWMTLSFFFCYEEYVLSKPNWLFCSWVSFSVSACCNKNLLITPICIFSFIMKNHTGLWTTYSVVLIPKCPRLSWDDHEARISEYTQPFRHGFILTRNMAWREVFFHIEIPCLNQASDFPKFILEGQGGHRLWRWER